MTKNKHGACIKSSLFGRKFVLSLAVILLIGDGSGCRLLQRDVPVHPPEANQEATLPIPEESVATENTSENDPAQEIPTNNTIVDNRPTAKGRPIITRLSGYELIRETVQRDGLPVTRYTIRGNATIVHQGVVIRAARMVIDDGRFGELQGGVRIIDRANGVTVISATAEYNRDEQVVHLVGNPYMIVQRPGQETALVSTNRITRKLEAGKSILDGDVRIKQGEWTLLADEGVYSDSEDLIVMRDDPLIIGRDRYMVASKLNYEVDRKRIRLKTDVALYSRGSGLALDDSTSNDANQQLPSLMEFARRGGRIDARELQSSGETVADGPLTSILTSDELIYHFPDDAEPFTTVTGNVLLTRDDMRLSSPYIEAIGRDFHTIWTDQGIDMLDRKRDMHVVARVMDYKTRERFLRLEGSPPSLLEFYKKESTEIEATLQGAVIERDFAGRRTTARGDVRINRGELKAIGEIAHYQEDAGVIVLEGNPGIQDGNNTVHCEKIFYYPESNRILLYNNIKGYLGTHRFESEFPGLRSPVGYPRAMLSLF